VEITAELTDLAHKELRRLYPIAAQYIRITVFDVADHILGSYDQELYKYATTKMAKEGVAIRTSCTIEKVEDTVLHIKDCESQNYGILLWVTGNKSVPLVDTLDLWKTPRGLQRILTDKYLNVKKTNVSGTVIDNIYALGDAADIEGNPMPTTAEVAVQKSQYLVQVLNNPSSRRAKGFDYNEKGLTTYIGNHDGIISGRKAEGFLSGEEAWLNWRSGSVTWTRSWRNKVLIVLSSVLNAVFGKDVTRL
jgi:NADH:ubiquinone reductase (non-electrogenic)